jgi:hypothetical protein
VIDPFGVLLALLRADPDVLAIVPASRISSVPTSPPCVVLGGGGRTRRPFGPTSGNLGLQLWLGWARCYGPDDTTGTVTVGALAGAVSDALHGHGPYIGSGNRYMVRSYTPDIDEIERDPDTHWPSQDVRIEAHFAAEAVA